MTTNFKQGMEPQDITGIALAAASLITSFVTAVMACIIAFQVSKPRLRLDITSNEDAIVITLRNSGGSAVRVLDIIRVDADPTVPDRGLPNDSERKLRYTFSDKDQKELKNMHDVHGNLYGATLRDSAWVGPNEPIELLRLDLHKHDNCRITAAVVFNRKDIRQSRFIILYKTIFRLHGSAICTLT